MVARFGIPGVVTPPIAGGPSPQAVAAARRALGCDPRASYLAAAITSSLTASRFIDNIGDSLGFTTMSFSADPARAAAQLCGQPAAGRSVSSR